MKCFCGKVHNDVIQISQTSVYRPPISVCYECYTKLPEQGPKLQTGEFDAFCGNCYRKISECNGCSDYLLEEWN